MSNMSESILLFPKLDKFVFKIEDLGATTSLVYCAFPIPNSTFAVSNTNTVA